MPSLVDRPFAAMNGLGNAILVVDLRGAERALPEAEVRALAEQFAFDQLMTLEAATVPGFDARTRIYNRDGSPAGACGNGTRCVAWLLMRETGQADLMLEGPAGPLHCARGLLPDTISVDMGPPRFGWDEIPLAEKVADTDALELILSDGDEVLPMPAAVNVGNPHVVFFVDDLDIVDLARFGPRVESDALFPDRANVSLAHVTAPDAMTLKVWERGAGLTRACGSAACAAAVLAARNSRTGRKVTVSLPGGDLFVDWRESDDHILMLGPVELEREGRLAADAVPA
jgi:diaminopimelate epimerase